MKALKRLTVQHSLALSFILIFFWTTLIDYLQTVTNPRLFPAAKKVPLSQLDLIKPLNLTLQITSANEKFCSDLKVIAPLGYKCHILKKTPRDSIYQIDFTQK